MQAAQMKRIAIRVGVTLLLNEDSCELNGVMTVARRLSGFEGGRPINPGPP